MLKTATDRAKPNVYLDSAQKMYQEKFSKVSDENFYIAMAFYSSQYLCSRYMWMQDLLCQ